ncbi:MAG TPA: type II secretion system protein N [Candidatus Aquabacterium excrementipullorum]|nr:type II secretion system protein N [Candidatus Aquabacterium excrementipullorum]
MRQAGRRWGTWGAVLGALLGLLMFAPASWLANAVSARTGGRLILAEAQGTVWSGDAVAVLTGGPGSRDARALPGRLGWHLRLQGLGLRLELTQDCCLPEPLALVVRPRWGKVQAELLNGRASPPAASGPPGFDPGVQGQWPAGWLSGLGTPWNTLELTGTLRLRTQGLRLEWAQGKLAVEGHADIYFQDVASRVTTLDRLGTYRLSLDGMPGQVMLSLATENGALQLSGSGSVGPAGARFRGEATASEAERGALGNLLNIIGRREGDRSVISIG